MSGASAAEAPRGRYPLDAVRAIAALGIIVFHAYQNNRFAGTETYPWTGLPHELMLSTDALVSLFFVISGFVLWLPVARAALQGRPQRPARILLLRRAARLVPLYLVVVLVVWTVSNPATDAAYWPDLLLHLTFTQVYSDQYIFWTVGPAWSLAVEFHFYLFVALSVPVLAWWIRRTQQRRGRLTGVLAPAVLMGSAGIGWLLWAIHISPQPGDDWSVWFGPLAKAPIFAFGMLLAVAVADGHRLAHRRHRVALGAGAAAAVLAGTTLRPNLPGQTSQWLGLAFGLAATAVLATIVMSDRPAIRWLNWKPLVRVGILSYSIYLLHEPIMRLIRYSEILPEPGSRWGVLVTSIVVVLASVLLAMLTYPFIEQYGMRLLDMFGPDGRGKNYYDHAIDEARPPSRRPTMRIDWVPDGELADRGP